MRFYVVIQCDSTSTGEPTSADLATINATVADRLRLDARAGEATGPSGIAVHWWALAVGPNDPPPTKPT